MDRLIIGPPPVVIVLDSPEGWMRSQIQTRYR
jgi:hypothetical protein